MGAEAAFDREAIDDLGAGPAFGGAQDDHRPAGALFEAVGAGVRLDLLDFGDDFVEGFGHQLMDDGGIFAFDEVGGVAVAAEELFELFVGDAGQDGGAGDFVAVEVKDGEDGAVAGGVEKFVGVPACGERAGFGFAVADDAGDPEVGIVEDGAEGVGEGVAKLAAFVDGAGGFGGDVAGDAAGKGELLEEAFHACFVLGDVGVELGVGAFEVGVGDEAGPAVAGAGDVDHVEVVLVNDAVAMDVDEIEAGGGAEMAEEAGLDVVEGEGLFEEGVVEEIDLADGEVVGGAPVGVDFLELVWGEGVGHFVPFVVSGEGECSRTAGGS